MASAKSRITTLQRQIQWKTIKTLTFSQKCRARGLTRSGRQTGRQPSDPRRDRSFTFRSRRGTRRTFGNGQSKVFIATCARFGSRRFRVDRVYFRLKIIPSKCSFWAHFFVHFSKRMQRLACWLASGLCLVPEELNDAVVDDKRRGKV